jgi:hypothetical protein
MKADPKPAVDAPVLPYTAVDGRRDQGGDDGGGRMSTALRLVRDSDGGDQLPPLVAWELSGRGTRS